MYKYLKILIVDDDEVDRLAIIRMLNKDEKLWHILEASNEEEALDLLNNLSIDCIIVDYLLPKSDGLKVLTNIRKHKNNVPIIMLTGKGDEETAVKAIKAGATDYLTKGKIASQDLIKSIKNSIRIHKAECATIQAQENLKKALDYQLKLFDDFPTLINRADVKGQKNYFNKKWLNFRGRTFQQERGDGWLEGIHSDDRQRVKDTYFNAVEKEEAFSIEYRLKRFDDEYRWVLAYVRPIYDLDDHFAGYMTNCHDITEKKHAVGRDRLLHEMAIKVIKEEPINDILQFVCEKLVYVYDFPLACMGYKNTDSLVSLKAAAGKISNIISSNKINFKMQDLQNPITRAFVTGMPEVIFTKDVRSELWKNNFSENNIKSILFLPLTMNSKIQGVLFLASSNAQFFKEEMIFHLKNLADQVAIAMQSDFKRHQIELQTTALISTADPVLILNARGEVEWINNAFSQLYGYESEEVLGKNLDFLEARNHTEFIENLKEAVFNGQSWKGVIHNNSKSGELVMVQSTITPILNAQGKVKNIVEIHTDITKSKLAEFKLREERQRLFNILDGLPAYVCLISQDFQISFRNKYFKENIGNPENRFCYEVFHGNKQPCEKCVSLKTIKEQKPQNFELTRPNGKTYEVYSYPYTDVDGTLLILEFGIDITEKIQGEELLQRYKLLSDSVNDIILMMQPDGTIVEANVAAERIYGFSRQELLSLKVHDLRAVGFENTDETLNKAKDKPILYETMHKRKDGRTFPVEVSSQGALVGDKFVLITIIRDITERKNSEAEIFKAKEGLARAERLASLGTMAAGIAHEINQPLNSLKVTADGMLYWHGKGRNIEVNKTMQNIQKISDQATRIDEIIKHIRLFVRSDYDITLVPCNINTAIENALKIIGNQLSSHGIILEKNLNTDLPEILAINTRLEEVVINLLINAMHALDSIDKRDKKIKCSTYKTIDSVVLEIADNGSGVGKEVINKIFEPFFTTKPVGEGMGLGLSIVHSIVSSFKGVISVDNAEDGGAVFEISFPFLRG